METLWVNRYHHRRRGVALLYLDKMINELEFVFRFFLAAQSEYFNKLFSNGMSESSKMTV